MSNFVINPHILVTAEPCEQTEQDELANIKDTTSGYGSRLGTQFLTGSCGVGDTVTSWTAKLQNNGGSGTVYARVYDNGGTLKLTIGSVAAASLPNSPSTVDHTFSDPDASYTLANEDRIVTEYDADTNGVNVAFDNNVNTDNQNFTYYRGSWQAEAAKNSYFKLNTA